jgi:hypothetical protein
VTDLPEPDARQRLLDALRTGACFCGADSCQNPDPLVDAYAHELAEQIRQDTTVMSEAGDQYALCYADLIDPKVQR